jgi:hypothetical protein
MVHIPSTAQDLADAYTQEGTHFGVAASDPTQELTVDQAPQYQRQPAQWNPGSGGVSTAKHATFDLPAGSYGYLLLCSGPDPSTSKVLDYCAINASLNYDGQITVAPSYTQT